jgi:hypothetical protein
VSTALSRRAFLGGVLGASALAVPLASPAGAAPASTNTVYWLNPDSGAGNPTCVPNHGQSGCGGCYACVRHYQNKIFATAAAADAGRAHPRCKCLVQAAFTVDDRTYSELFGATDSADRRTPGVNELLAGASVAPTTGTDATAAAAATPTTGALALTGSGLMPLAAAGVGAVALGAALRRVGRGEQAASPSPDS